MELDDRGLPVLGRSVGGSALLAAGADLTGRPGLRKVSRVGALASILASLYFLVADLGRPERFHHMLRVAKPSSPMSMGTWILSAYGPGAAVAAAGELMPGRLRRTDLPRTGRPRSSSSMPVSSGSDARNTTGTPRAAPPEKHISPISSSRERSSAPPPCERRHRNTDQRRRRHPRVLPHRARIPRRHHRVRRQAVHLRLVEQQKNRRRRPPPSFGVVGRTNRASVTPRACNCSTRRAARSRNSSSGPNWIESVGHAFAHAGSSPSCSRS